MAESFILIIACALFGLASAAPEGRIIGGQVVSIIKHSYVVSIRYSEQENAYIHKCAGVIYSEKVVVTAAQCVVDIRENEQIMIVAAANSRTGLDGFLYPAFHWFSHPNYSSWTVDYDIGVIMIDHTFDFGSMKISPISIQELRPIDGKLATVAGWGYREEFGPSSSKLEEVQVPIVSSEDCTNSYGVGEITERMICAGYLHSGGKDSCQGDTGGPLIVDNHLVGLVSWGRGCARPGYPTVYTFVSSLKQWIDETISMFKLKSDY